MSDLESRYRTVLYWYPSSWREQNAEIVIGTLLDEADAAGRVRPRVTEIADLAVNGIRVRLGRATTVSRGTRDRLAALSFGAGFALMAIMFFGDEWAPLTPDRFAGWPVGFGPFLSVAVVVNLLWMLAFALGVLGAARWARVLLGVAALSSVAAIVLVDAGPMFWARPPATALTLVVVLALLSIAGKPSRRALLMCGVVALAVIGAFIVVQYHANSWSLRGGLHEGWSVSANGWAAIALLALAALLVVIRRVEWIVPVTASAALWALYGIGTAFTAHRDFMVVVLGLLGLGFAIVVLAVASFLLRGYRLQVVRPARE